MRPLIFTLFVVLLAGGCRKHEPVTIITYSGKLYGDCEQNPLAVYYMQKYLDPYSTPNFIQGPPLSQKSGLVWEHGINLNWEDERLNFVFSEVPGNIQLEGPYFILYDVPTDITTRVGLELEVYLNYEIDLYIQYLPVDGATQAEGLIVRYKDLKTGDIYQKEISGPITPGSIIDTISGFWLSRAFYPDLDIYHGTLWIGDHADPDSTNYSQHIIQVPVCSIDSLLFTIE